MVAASADGKRAYVTSLKDGVVTVIDLPGGVAGDVTTGKGAEGVDVTPDGREIWVANRNADTISVIDAKTLKVAATIPASHFPIRVRISPDGKRAVVAFTESGDVGVYDVATRTEIKRIPLGHDAVAATGKRVFQGRFGASAAPVGLLISPDSKRAWVSATHADVVVVLDLVNLKVEDAWSAGKEPDGLSGRFEKK
jgi:YVTN family beta-propeller protein